MEVRRRKFQGALNILSFNRHFYYLGIIMLVVLVAVMRMMNLPSSLCWLIIIAFLYGLIAPLLVSAYVYDFSGFYDLDWLKQQLPDRSYVKTALNINAGFDETSFIINNLIPQATLKVFDFYNSKRHTEPAIKRARKVSLVYPGTLQIETHFIPLPDQSADVIFLFSAIHEIRSHEEKIIFLKECRRVCKPEGKVIMIEHLRDLPNFLAFTVGFTHFFSAFTWENALRSAGFVKINKKKFTPFMSVFNCS